ncbi:MAG: CPBP family intramembrane metalloprotease [Planctomycetota bacterium]|nr:MAG: CPBP family intramembrane metalloprotease [Planctomycetota bacterium]
MKVSASNRRPLRPGFVLVILAFFALGIAAPKIFFYSSWYQSHRSEWSIHLRLWIQPAWWTVCIASGWVILEHMRRKVADSRRPRMGVLISPARAGFAVVFAFVCAVPMLALGLLSPPSPDRDLLFYGTVQAGFFEEWFFRAFAFGLLIQLGRMRLWPAAVLTGTIFGLVHLRGYSLSALTGQWTGLAFIGLGGVMYAWLFWRWRWNLWVVIALHTFMNLWWGLFELGDNSLGPWAATASRVITIGLAITLTEFMVKSVRFGRLFPPDTMA